MCIPWPHLVTALSSCRHRYDNKVFDRRGDIGVLRTSCVAIPWGSLEGTGRNSQGGAMAFQNKAFLCEHSSASSCQCLGNSL
eukprot:4434190-Amphidinium_carterae.1